MTCIAENTEIPRIILIRPVYMNISKKCYVTYEIIKWKTQDRIILCTKYTGFVSPLLFVSIFEENLLFFIGAVQAYMLS